MHSGAVCSDSSVSVSNRSSYTFFQYDKKFTTQHLFFCKAGRELPPFIRWWLAFTHPSLSSIFFHKFPIVVIVEGGVAINSLLLAQVMILIFGTVHRSVGDLQCKRSAWGSRIPARLHGQDAAAAYTYYWERLMSSAKSTAEECCPGVLSIEQCQEGSRLLVHSSPAFIRCFFFFSPCLLFLSML